MALKSIDLESSSDGDGVIETKEIIQDAPDKFKVSTANERVWSNQALRSYTLPLTCVVPHSVLITMRTIEHHIKHAEGMGTLEFGAFLKGKFEDGKLVLDESFCVVKQKVTGASIDFEEEPPPEFNGVIHRHPDSCTHFSGTDAASINQNYEFSLLYVNDNITTGIANIQTPTVRVQIPLKVEIKYPIFSMDCVDILSKITKEHQVARYQPSLGGFSNNPLSDGTVLGRQCFLGDREDDGVLSFEDDSLIPDKNWNLGNEKIVCCAICGNFQMVDDLPAKCESCDEIIEFLTAGIVDTSTTPYKDEDGRILDEDEAAEVQMILRNKYLHS